MILDGSWVESTSFESKNIIVWNSELMVDVAMRSGGNITWWHRGSPEQQAGTIRSALRVLVKRMTVLSLCFGEVQY